MPTPPRHWTQEELDILRGDYHQDRQSLAAVARRLAIPVSTVSRQLAAMGLSRNNDRRRWTPEEDQQLLDLVERRPLITIASAMGRSIASVAARAKYINASRKHRDRWYTLQETAAITGMNQRALLTRIGDGALRATRHNFPQDHGHQQSHGSWHIEERDLRRFIRQQPQDLSGRRVDAVQLVQVLAGLAPIQQAQGPHQDSPAPARPLTPVDLRTTDGTTAFGVAPPSPGRTAALIVLTQLPSQPGIWRRTAAIDADELAQFLAQHAAQTHPPLPQAA